MTPEQRAAFINAQAVSAFAEIQGMVADNENAAANGYTRPYGFQNFIGVRDAHVLDHDQLIRFFEE